jgi:hypothetical protein
MLCPDKIDDLWFFYMDLIEIHEEVCAVVLLIPAGIMLSGVA